MEHAGFKLQLFQEHEAKSPDFPPIERLGAHQHAGNTPATFLEELIITPTDHIRTHAQLSNTRPRDPP